MGLTTLSSMSFSVCLCRSLLPTVTVKPGGEEGFRELLWACVQCVYVCVHDGDAERQREGRRLRDSTECSSSGKSRGRSP